METEEIREKFNQFVISGLADELSMSVEDIDINADVLEYGVDSIAVAGISTAIEKKYDFQLDAKIFFQSEDLEELLDNIWEGNKDKIIIQYQ